MYFTKCFVKQQTLIKETITFCDMKFHDSKESRRDLSGFPY